MVWVCAHICLVYSAEHLRPDANDAIGVITDCGRKGEIRNPGEGKFEVVYKSNGMFVLQVG